MKGFLFLAVVASALYLSSSAITKDMKAKIVATAEKCRKEFPVTDEEFNHLAKMHEVPESENGQCMVACYLKEMGYFHDGKFDIEAMKESHKIKWDDEDSVAKADKVLDTCHEQVGEDENECHLTAKLVKCLIENGKKEGIHKPDVEE